MTTLGACPLAPLIISGSTRPLWELVRSPLEPPALFPSNLLSPAPSPLLHPRPRLLGPPRSRLARPFWACLRPLRQSGEPTRPPLIKVTGGAWHGAREIIPPQGGPHLFSPRKQADTDPSQQRSARASWRENRAGKPTHHGCSLFCARRDRVHTVLVGRGRRLMVYVASCMKGVVWNMMGALSDGSVVGWERCWMLVGWWSGGETIIEWWFDGGSIKIKKEKRYLRSQPFESHETRYTRGRG